MALRRTLGDSRNLTSAEPRYEQIASEAEEDGLPHLAERERSLPEGSLVGGSVLDELHEAVLLASSKVTGDKQGVFITPDGISVVKTKVWARLAVLGVLFFFTFPLLVVAWGVKCLVCGSKQRNLGLWKACLARVMVLLYGILFLVLAAPTVLFMLHNHGHVFFPSVQLASTEITMPFTFMCWMSGLFCARVLDNLFNQAGARAIHLAFEESRALGAMAKDVMKNDSDGQVFVRRVTGDSVAGSLPSQVSVRRSQSRACSLFTPSGRRALDPDATKAQTFVKTVNDICRNERLGLRAPELLFFATFEDYESVDPLAKALHDPRNRGDRSRSWGSLGLLISMACVHAVLPDIFRLVCQGWQEALLPTDSVLLSLRISFVVLRFACTCAWFDRLQESVQGVKLVRQKYILTLYLSATDDHRTFLEEFYSTDLPRKNSALRQDGADDAVQALVTEAAEVPIPRLTRMMTTGWHTDTHGSLEGSELADASPVTAPKERDKSFRRTATDMTDMAMSKSTACELSRGLRCFESRILCTSVFMLVRRYLRAVLTVECLHVALTTLLLMFRVGSCMVSFLSILLTVDKLVPDLLICFVDASIAIVCIVLLFSEVISTGDVIHRDTLYVLHGWKHWVHRLQSAVSLEKKGYGSDTDKNLRSKARGFREACDYIREVDQPLMLWGVPFTSNTRSSLILSFLSMAGFAMVKVLGGLGESIKQLRTMPTV